MEAYEVDVGQEIVLREKSPKLLPADPKAKVKARRSTGPPQQQKSLLSFFTGRYKGEPKKKKTKPEDKTSFAKGGPDFEGQKTRQGTSASSPVKQNASPEHKRVATKFIKAGDDPDFGGQKARQGASAKSPVRQSASPEHKRVATEFIKAREAPKSPKKSAPMPSSPTRKVVVKKTIFPSSNKGKKLVPKSSMIRKVERGVSKSPSYKEDSVQKRTVSPAAKRLTAAQQPDSKEPSQPKRPTSATRIRPDSGERSKSKTPPSAQKLPESSELSHTNRPTSAQKQRPSKPKRPISAQKQPVSTGASKPKKKTTSGQKQQAPKPISASQSRITPATKTASTKGNMKEEEAGGMMHSVSNLGFHDSDEPQPQMSEVSNMEGDSLATDVVQGALAEGM